ncbi:MAG TPA: arylamine N-acetyltransferase [candidate division Zixibacteria bacterium]|nr:arylamine N-acetyltransferase [candidate division Zixibacteria bacterium]
MKADSHSVRKMQAVETALYDRYLALLGKKRSRPCWDELAALTAAHLQRIPFENVSKIYRVRVQGERGVPQLAEFLANVERYKFGGTCFVNNFYFNLLLSHLGYDVRLCSADIAVEGAPPDGHMLNVVTLDGTEAIVDVGFGAPFWHPLNRNHDTDIQVRLGAERYALKPQDDSGRSRLEVYREERLVHGYLMKPHAREVSEFAEVISRSYSDRAPFLNRLTIIRFYDDWALTVRNNKLAKLTGPGVETTRLETRAEITETVVTHFGMPEEIVTAALETLDDEVLFAE